MSQKISHYAYSEVRNITTTYFEDGSFDTASGDIRPKKEEVVEDTAAGDDLDTSTEIPDVVEVEDEGEGVVTVEEEKTDAEEKTVTKKLVTRKKKK